MTELCIKIQLAPRSKHTPSGLLKRIEQSLFVLRSIQNTKMRYVCITELLSVKSGFTWGPSKAFKVTFVG
jgi:hypothetical protein